MLQKDCLILHLSVDSTPFVRNLEQALEQKNDNKTTYADILIEDYLKDIIKKIQK